MENTAGNNGQSALRRHCHEEDLVICKSYISLTLCIGTLLKHLKLQRNGKIVFLKFIPSLANLIQHLMLNKTSSTFSLHPSHASGLTQMVG